MLTRRRLDSPFGVPALSAVMPLAHYFPLPELLDLTTLRSLTQHVEHGQFQGAEVLLLRCDDGSLGLAPCVDLAALRPVEASLIGDAYEALLASLRACPLPTLALADGPVVGAQIGILAACDVVIATPAATFGAPPARRPHQVPESVFVPSLSRRLRLPDAERLVGARDGVSENAAWGSSTGLVDELIVEPAITAAVARWVRFLAGATPDQRRHVRERLEDRPSIVVAKLGASPPADVEVGPGSDVEPCSGTLVNEAEDAAQLGLLRGCFERRRGSSSGTICPGAQGGQCFFDACHAVDRRAEHPTKRLCGEARGGIRERRGEALRAGAIAEPKRARDPHDAPERVARFSRDRRLCVPERGRVLATDEMYDREPSDEGLWAQT